MSNVNIFLTLPWPPSANRRLQPGRRRWINSRLTKDYYDQINADMFISGIKYVPVTAPLAIDIKAYPPKKRCLDIDNILKHPLDALQKQNVIKNDSQIKKLTVEIKKSVPKGMLEITIINYGT